MKKFSEILERCPLFFDIAAESKERMLHCLGARVERYEKGSTVFAEGGRADHLGIVLTGKVLIIQVDYYGNRSILAECEPSQIILEAFACAGTESVPVSVIADSPTEIMFIDCSHILYTCENNCGHHQRLIYNLMKDLAVNTVDYHTRIGITSKRTTREKLLAYLYAESRRRGGKKFDVPFDRQELADYLEVDRSGLSAEIGKMKREGIIDSNKNYFELL